MSRHRARLWRPATMRAGEVRPRSRRAGVAVTSAAAVGVVLVAAYVATPTPTGVEPGRASVAAADSSTEVGLTAAETIFLHEMADAGIQLDPVEAAVAVRIAREHVAHGHLVGMREWIRSDFREGVPRLTEEQVDVARVVVEHHFQRVTGRKQ